jgi:hypothetical protein
VPGSQRLDAVRLRNEYSGSTSEADDQSRRITEDEVRQRGLERRIVTCPKNTLLMANTFGYHHRSAGQPGASRRALHMSFRFNPFSSEKGNVARAKRVVARATRPRR